MSKRNFKNSKQHSNIYKYNVKTEIRAYVSVKNQPNNSAKGSRSNKLLLLMQIASTDLMIKGVDIGLFYAKKFILKNT